MRISLITAALLSAFSITSFADEAAPAAAAAEAAPAVAAAPAEPVSPHTFTFNLGLYSEYMFRGVALSDGPALQGGADYGHSSGFYAGTWFSNTDKEFLGHDATGLTNFSGGNRVEIDIYAGWAKTFENGLGINFLGNYYYYPDREDSLSLNDNGNKQDSFEVSAALTYKSLTYTFFYMPTDYYGASRDFTRDGTSDTDGATYNELKFNYALPFAGLNLMAKVGYQHTPNLTGSQADLAIGVSRSFSIPSAGKPIEGFSAGAYYTDTFAVKDEVYYDTTDGRDTNEEKLWFFVKRTW